MKPRAAPQAAPPTPSEQRIAQRYAVEAEIARGGMGVVYKVREIGSGKVFALKRMLFSEGGRREVFLSGFEREYQVLASLDHPGIIRVFDYGFDGDEPYYTMDFVQGRDLRELAPVPWREACRHLRDVASALSLLHARRLLHRDLSPGNVKVTPEGRGKLLDFGALSEFGYPKWIVGTPPLIAPEALVGGMLDQRTDLYSLGALAYWLVTGRHAYPAPRLDDLPSFWKRVPPLPSAFDRDIPPKLDALILSLLSANPLARSDSAAEVIAKLNGVAALEPEEEGERQRIARSFLVAPPFIGRDGQIEVISDALSATVKGHGGTLLIHGAPGSGRTRLLEEAGVRAQILGATVLRIDATMCATGHGASRALIIRMLEALPVLAVQKGQRFRSALALLGRDVRERFGDHDPGEPVMVTQSRTSEEGELADFFVSVSRAKPLVIQVDNASYLDDASLGLLLSLARMTRRHKLMLMIVDRIDAVAPPAMGMRTLRELATTVALPNLSAGETLGHVRSMFGAAPNVARFAEWLYGRTAGNPLMCVELSRQLVDRQVIRYEGGMWELPISQPTTEHSPRIEEVLSARIARLSPPALALTRCLSLQRHEVTLTLCVLVSDGLDERRVHALLDELAYCDVMQAEQATYRFSSSALHEVLLATMSDREREACHLRLGRAFIQLAGEDPVLRIEAGWHLIRGGRDLEGADMIAEVMRHAMVVRRLNANMYRIAEPAEAALNVYKRNRRSPCSRLPFLCGLAQAGFFEDWRWDERYADETLDLMDELSGMRLARRLRFLGRHLALCIAIPIAAIGYLMIPKRDRPFSFALLLTHLFGTVLSAVAVAALKLDGDRAERVATILEPFTALPKNLTGPSLFRFCRGIQEVAREHQVEAAREFEDIAQRIGDPRHFRMIPADARIIFVCAAHFARGGFAIFRDDGRAALESASVLELSGLRVYAMVGAQLRYLYHLNRGEFALAEPHRERVELHAAHFGAAWQVEMWEAPSLLPLQLALEDVTGVTRLAHRLELQSRDAPSLRLYARLSAYGVLVARRAVSRNLFAQMELELAEEDPRSFIGWSTAISVLASAYNQEGLHAQARACCERALAITSDRDRDYVTLFLRVDLEAAIADGKLGHTAAAFARLDGLLTRFQESTHPLTLGLIHEARARLAWEAGRIDDYELSLGEVERWFGRSDVPALVAKFNRLVELQRPVDTVRGKVLPANTNADPDDLDLDTDVTKM